MSQSLAIFAVLTCSLAGMAFVTGLLIGALVGGKLICNAFDAAIYYSTVAGSSCVMCFGIHAWADIAVLEGHFNVFFLSLAR